MSTKNEPGGQSFIERARRSQILAATAAVVANEGYAKASLARIAKEAGVSKGVVTYHFTNKDEILEQMVTDYFTRGWEYMEPRIYAEPTAVGQVNAWISAQLEFFTTHPTEFFAMVSVMSNHRNDDGSSRYDADTREAVDGLAEILDSGQREGQLRDFDTVSVADIILRSIDGVISSWAHNPGMDMTKEIDVLKDFISHAIRKAPS
ncbi:TetR/AcrR family transcriptional regulator [Corynebacterium sp.]|jgi:AcrR family transcriptional regulator|uniref:TetR/AcrR family transcriptional regulator n=1 Tax=Corynebacterium sp. TaxID=1720 RepID=UPI0025B947A4|nr:TetR/AcrR family transcriptional regulator [Corynebacterium sp.]